MTGTNITLTDIRKAALRIQPYVYRTPIFSSSILNELTKAQLFYKCENFQRTGSFKFRGACNAVFSLPNDIAQLGVATHSSGNHGQALALAAKLRGIPAYIVMPDDSPQVKRQAVAGYGARITYCERDISSREKTLAAVTQTTGASYIPPYDHVDIIAGQGTVALEFISDLTESLDFIITPLGGGGLLSGTAIVVSTLTPSLKIIGAEPLQAHDAYLAFQEKKLIVDVTNKPSICDGLLVPLGKITSPYIFKYVHDILLADEADILQATQLIWERMKIVVEPSAAIALAIVLLHLDTFKNKKIGLILSGGNVDIKKIAALF